MFNSLLREADFQLRNLVLSAPIPGYGRDAPLAKLPRSAFERAADELSRDGVTVLAGFATAEQVGRLRAQVDDAFAHPRPELDVRSAEQSSYRQAQILEALLLGKDATDLAFHPDLLAIVSCHLGRRAKLVDCDFGRTIPVTMDELRSINENIRKSSSNVTWHYDNRGRQVKIMFYLTDVGPDGQNFAYCAGTHRGFKSSRNEFSRFTDEWVEEHVRDVREVYAPAGSALIFDTRGIHRLRRKATYLRDAITFYYHAGFLQKFPPKIARSTYDSLAPHLRETLVPVD